MFSYHVAGSHDATIHVDVMKYRDSEKQLVSFSNCVAGSHDATTCADVMKYRDSEK